jgi:RsiW-degrading membrane proteinase PrsW (M82 family)
MVSLEGNRMRLKEAVVLFLWGIPIAIWAAIMLLGFLMFALGPLPPG